MLKAGVSIVEISPGKGIELAGYPHFLRKNTGIHDPLYASCMILDDGSTRIVLVCMDILFFSKKYVYEVRRRVSRKIKIKPENIMMSCSHTHSGPWASGRLDLEALEKGLTVDNDYIEGLIDKVTTMIINATKNMFNAEIGIDLSICGKECGVGGNRSDTEGPNDPEVWVIGVRDSKGDLRAAMVKYSLHPTVIHEDSTVVTGDYPAYIREHLSERFPGIIMLFAQGTSGNQSTRYFRKEQSFSEAKRIGKAIEEKAEEVLNNTEYMRDLKLFIVSKEINVDLRKLPTEEEAEKKVRETKERQDELRKKNSTYIQIQNANLINLGAECTLGYVRLKKRGIPVELEKDELPVEVQVIGIGETRIVALQGEIFVEFGLEIKRKSPFNKTFVIELANGVLPGYVCTENSINEGSYEAGTSMLSEKTGEIIVDTAVELLKKSQSK